MKPASKIDPHWAWSQYDGPWGRREAAHLLRRASFSASAEQVAVAAASSPHDVVAGLVNQRAPADFQQEMETLAAALLAASNPRQLSAWWLYRMLHSPDGLLEKTTLFWHGHFATSAEKVQDARLMYDQNKLLRQHALGAFEPMVQDLSRDPAMLIYLDSVTNRKAHPNENYAREVMELFCLGEGNYTERDVQEVARCFTGWELRRKQFRFNRFQHDAGSKEVLGQRGDLGGEDAVRIILEQPAAPRFIAEKLVKYFIVDEPTPDPAVIELLATQLREYDFQIGPLLQRILTSQLFYSEMAIGRKIRSPVELAMGVIRGLQMTTDMQGLAGDLEKLGHALFYPPNVKGWDGGRSWINSSTLLGRANMIQRIMQSENTRFAGGNLEELFERLSINEPEQRVNWLLDQLVAVPVADSVREQLIDVARKSDTADSTMKEVVCLIGTLPEIQLN